MNPLIPPSQAAERIRHEIPQFPSIDCPIDKCAGRILREDMLADRPLPPFDRAMMDGYALRFADIAAGHSFRILGQAPAGQPAATLDKAIGSCIEIMTGAVVPVGADCVVPYEETERGADGEIRLTSPDTLRSGNAIHPLGSDHEAGEVFVRSGRLLGGREIAIAATCGYASLKVTKLPAIAIVSTGDELVDVATQPEAHQIRRSNDLSIETALTRAGYSAQKRVHLQDDAASIAEALPSLIAENDVVIISGGISMGQKDFIPEALRDAGLTCHFHGVAQKPGKPFGFWTNKDCAVFALPGNPISTLTCLHHYVIPALFAASGQTTAIRKTSVTLNECVKARDDISIFLPVEMGPGNRATPRPINNSGDLVRILESHGYIELPPTLEKSYPIDSEFTFHQWM